MQLWVLEDDGPENIVDSEDDQLDGLGVPFRLFVGGVFSKDVDGRVYFPRCTGQHGDNLFCSFQIHAYPYISGNFGRYGNVLEGRVTFWPAAGPQRLRTSRGIRRQLVLRAILSAHAGVAKLADAQDLKS